MAGIAAATEGNYFLYYRRPTKLTVNKFKNFVAMKMSKKKNEAGDMRGY